MVLYIITKCVININSEFLSDSRGSAYWYSKTAPTAIKILPGKMSTAIHFFKDNFTSVELYTSNRWLLNNWGSIIALIKLYLN